MSVRRVQVTVQAGVRHIRKHNYGIIPPSVTDVVRGKVEGDVSVVVQLFKLLYPALGTGLVPRRVGANGLYCLGCRPEDPLLLAYECILYSAPNLPRPVQFREQALIELKWQGKM